jgi:hypothetical protein
MIMISVGQDTRRGSASSGSLIEAAAAAQRVAADRAVRDAGSVQDQQLPVYLIQQAIRWGG